MSFEGPERGLDYYPCRYGESTTVFRGPAVPLDGPYVVVLGGSEVYGRYVEDPFTDQLAERLGLRVVNLGVLNAGIDVFMHDDALMGVIGNAETVVVQTLGAHNMSNRFYTVHPRRNDRFVKQSPMLETLYRDVDFSDFAFTRHLLASLRKRCPDRFATLCDELQIAWAARMRAFLSRLPEQRILLSIEHDGGHELGPEPLYVSSAMVDGLRDVAATVLSCDVTADLDEANLQHMIYSETDLELARRSLSPPAHERIADALSQAIGAARGIAA